MNKRIALNFELQITQNQVLRTSSRKNYEQRSFYVYKQKTTSKAKTYKKLYRGIPPSPDPVSYRVPPTLLTILPTPKKKHF